MGNFEFVKFGHLIQLINADAGDVKEFRKELHGCSSIPAIESCLEALTGDGDKYQWEISAFPERDLGDG